VGRGGGPGGPGPTKIWVKKKKKGERKKAGGAKKKNPAPPPPLLGQSLDLPLHVGTR